MCNNNPYDLQVQDAIEDLKQIKIDFEENINKIVEDKIEKIINELTIQKLI